MPERIYVGTKMSERDGLGEKVRLRIISDLGIGTVGSIRTVVVYIINASLYSSDLKSLAEGPLCDPVIQDYTTNSSFCDTFNWMVEVGFRPGVTDNVGRTAKEAIILALKRPLPEDFSVHTATQYFFTGNMSRKQVEKIANEMLANKLIQTIKIFSNEEWRTVHARHFDAPVFTSSDKVTPYREVDLEGGDDVLNAISSDGSLALSLDEMHAIRDYYRKPDTQQSRRTVGLPLGPTNVELEVLAQTWSEHCKHKIFNANITYIEDDRQPHRINSLFKCYIQKATTDVRHKMGDRDICLSVFKDDAGIIRFNGKWAISFKVETHNSPSALDPYGGALTGIVGVNRDSFAAGMGGRLIANTDVFCFASPFYDKSIPPRILHPKRVFEGVREGVEHGGNKSGIPTVNGCIVFDSRFLGKPLVYCGTLAILPIELNGKKGYEKKANAGNHIMMVGGRIGKDGIHGATFSSEPLHENSPATAVQIGDPITQKRATDFLLCARDKSLFTSMTDNGAGGLSSSIGEMAKQTGGAIVHLERAPLKYHGLEPWEIFLSEAQERMTVAVAPDKVSEFLSLSKEWNVESVDLGIFTDTGNLEIWYENSIVGCLSMAFLHDGLPPMELVARWTTPVRGDEAPVDSADIKADLLGLLRSLNICSKEYVVRQYDHEVQGGSVVKPLCGARNDGPSDAAVIRPLLDSFEGLVVSNGISPRYSDIDTYAMTMCSFDEAVRNAVCTGADPRYMAALDNFCWSDPVKSRTNPDGEYKLAQLVRANQALYDICQHYSIPLISGKDSMKNDYRIGTTRISIPQTLLVSLVARIDDVRTAVTMDFKHEDNLIYLVGKTWPEMGASEYSILKGLSLTSVPTVRAPKKSYKSYLQLHEAIIKGYVRSAHDCSDGGLGVAVTEMCFSGELGALLDLREVPQEGCVTDTELLFSESQSRIVVEVLPEAASHFEQCLDGSACKCIGKVVKGDHIMFMGLKGQIALKVSRIDAKAAWKSTLQW